MRTTVKTNRTIKVMKFFLQGVYSGIILGLTIMSAHMVHSRAIQNTPPSYVHGSQLALEAFCSANSAGVNWTAVSPSYNGYIDLHFTCTPSNGETTRISEDECFHKQRWGLPALAHMDYTSMTHVIGKELTPGTECQFTADVLSRFEDHLETLTASCIVEGADARDVLPANCSVISGVCQCSCSPGYEGRADNNIDGNTCEAVTEPTTTTPEPVTTLSGSETTSENTDASPTIVTPSKVQCSVITVTETVTVTVAGLSPTPVVTKI